MLYVAVATAAVLSDRAADNPLLDIFAGAGAWVFACVGFLAVGNGVLVQIVMLARLFYGMARNRQLPTLFARVNSRTGTPYGNRARRLIVTGAAAVVSFEQLLVLTNALTLASSCWWTWRSGACNATPGGRAGIRYARLDPPVAAVLAAGLMLAELL